MQYLYSTQLLTLAEQQGAPRVQQRAKPCATTTKKLAILNYPQFTAPTIVTTRASDVRQFLAKHGDIIGQTTRRHGRHGHFQAA